VAERAVSEQHLIERGAKAAHMTRRDGTGVAAPRAPKTSNVRARRCLFIEGDPIFELRQGRDPFCNAPVLGTHPYCARHCLRAYYRPEEG
jgi:hypothetical protein